jgi:uncharacterized lipoprotein YbaY
MKIRNIIAVLWMASVMGGCAQSSTIVTAPANRLTSSNAPTVSKHTTYMNGATLQNGASLPNGAQLPNGTSLPNGKSCTLALTNLATRPLAKKD